MIQNVNHLKTYSFLMDFSSSSEYKIGWICFLRIFCLSACFFERKIEKFVNMSTFERKFVHIFVVVIALWLSGVLISIFSVEHPMIM